MNKNQKDVNLDKEDDIIELDGSAGEPRIANNKDKNN